MNLCDFKDKRSRIPLNINLISEILETNKIQGVRSIIRAGQRAGIELSNMAEKKILLQRGLQFKGKTHKMYDKTKKDGGDSHSDSPGSSPYNG